MNPPVLQVRHVTVEHHGKKVLAVDDLAIRAGETLSIVGPNGAGKSTLLRVLALLETPASGEVRFAGEAVGARRGRLLALRRRTAIVLQAPLLCRGSVFRNVALGLAFRGVPRRDIEPRVSRWLERFGIAGLRDRSVDKISGGEAQRTSLARAFVLEPEVLLLDEPFGALDPAARQTLIAELRGVLAETRTTTVFVTHDRDEAFALGERMAVLLDGRLAQIGAPLEIAERPADERLARFVGVETLLAGRVESAAGGVVRVAVAGVRIEAASSRAPGEAVTVCIRSENVSLAAAEAPNGAANRLRGIVTTVSAWGADVRVTVDCGVPIVARLPKPAARRLALEPGRGVTVTFEPSAVHLIPRTAEATT